MFFVRIAIKCIIEENNKILLMKEASGSTWRAGTWSLPGGKMDPEETFVQTFHRELKEETGLKVKPLGLFRIEEIISKDENGNRLVHHFVFLGKKIGGKLKDKDRHVEALEWFSKKELLEFPIDNLSEFYYHDLFKNYFKNKKNLFPLSKIKIWNAETNKDFNKWLKIIPTPSSPGVLW